MIEVLVTWRSNPMVHWITFSSISQHEDEPIRQYLVHFRATATDCNFSCPCCEHDLPNIYIKDQFIRGIANNALQTDLRAKARMLKSLDQNICHAEEFESAQGTKLQWHFGPSNNPDVNVLQTRYVWSPVWKRSMTICWNDQSGDRVKMIGSHGGAVDRIRTCAGYKFQHF